MNTKYIMFGIGAVVVGGAAAFVTSPGFTLPFGGAQATSLDGATPDEIATIQRCDQLAAHPSDPHKKASGVEDASLEVEAAIEACRAALEVYPQSTRLGYQLGRALVHNGEIEDGMQYLVASSEAGHGGAMALMADIFLNGTETITAEPETAVGLYAQAAAAGFKPAEEVLKSFAATDARRSDIPAELDFEAFEAPAVHQAIYTGQLNYSTLGTVGGAGYMFNMADAFRSICPGTFKKAEVDSYSNRIIRGAMKQAFDPAVQQQTLMNGLNYMRDLIENPEEAIMSQIGGDLPSNEEIPYAAANDAMMFAQMYRCDSPVGGRFIENLRKAMEL